MFAFLSTHPMAGKLGSSDPAANAVSAKQEYQAAVKAAPVNASQGPTHSVLDLTGAGLGMVPSSDFREYGLQDQDG